MSYFPRDKFGRRHDKHPHRKGCCKCGLVEDHPIHNVQKSASVLSIGIQWTEHANTPGVWTTLQGAPITLREGERLIVEYGCKDGQPFLLSHLKEIPNS